MLRRKPRVRPIDPRGYDQNGHLENEDLPWLFAGYKMGAFKEHLPENLTESEFVEAFIALTSASHEIYVGVAPLEKNASRRGGSHQIVGVASVAFNEHRGEAHALWMPWATPKNKLEVAAKFFAEMRRGRNMIIPVRAPARTMFRHLCRLGLMRHVGKIDNYFPDGETASVFQTLEMKNAR